MSAYCLVELPDIDLLEVEMALYKVDIFTRKAGDEKWSLLAIAGIVGKPVDELKVDRTRQFVNTVSLVVEGDLMVARSIQSLGLVVRTIC